MKKLILILSFTIRFFAFGESIDGPANVRNTPEGEKIFTLNNKVDVEIKGREGDWLEIRKTCFVSMDDLTGMSVVKANTALYNYEGDIIGHSLSEFKLDKNLNNWSYYQNIQKAKITLTGYTFKNNIREYVSYSDTCVSSLKRYYDENGNLITSIRNCSFYKQYLLIDGKYVPNIIHEIQEIKESTGYEGQESTIKVKIINDNLYEKNEVREFTVNADKIEIENEIIRTVKYSCCASENEHVLYNSANFKKLMEYNSELFKIIIPNSNRKGYIGYKTVSSLENGKMVLGTISFTNGYKTLNRVIFFTKDENKFKNIISYTPEMEFISNAEEDNTKGTEIILYSKISSTYSTAFNDFHLLIHFINDLNGELYTQKLSFINGYINGNKSPEIEICID